MLAKVIHKASRIGTAQRCLSLSSTVSKWESDDRLVAGVDDIRQRVQHWRQEGLRVGFVPTMGALHRGHLALVEEARKRCDRVVVSVFVNPAQFAPHEDFDRYPRTLGTDLDKLDLEASRADLVFAPVRADIYGKGHSIYVTIEGVDSVSEGAARPGFFRGVATVVTKLANIVTPHEMFFGQKDGLQCIVVNKVARELNLPLEIVVCPTEREEDGLAMSSRNVYLSDNERAEAPRVFQALQAVEKAFQHGERSCNALKETGSALISQHTHLATLEYLSLSSCVTAKEMEGHVEEDVMVSIAVRMGDTGTRLIDNLVLSVG